jgi:hypothetical protein
LNDADHNYSWRNTMLPRYMSGAVASWLGSAGGACITPVASACLGGIRSWLAGVFFILFFALDSQPAGWTLKQLTSRDAEAADSTARHPPYLIRY